MWSYLLSLHNYGWMQCVKPQRWIHIFISKRRKEKLSVVHSQVEIFIHENLIHSFEIFFGSLLISKPFLGTLPWNSCPVESVKKNETLKTRFLPRCLSARDADTYDSIVLSAEINASVIFQCCLTAWQQCCHCLIKQQRLGWQLENHSIFLVTMSKTTFGWRYSAPEYLSKNLFLIVSKINLF